MDDIEDTSPFCIGFTIFQSSLACVVAVVVYRVVSNPLLMIAMAMEWSFVAMKLFCSAVWYNLTTYSLCFIFGMALCGFLIQRYWTGK